MATIEELHKQIDLLNQTIASLEDSLKSKTNTEYSIFINNQKEFAQSTSITSGTIASFSLLLLQINNGLASYLKPKFLLAGFVVLIANVFLIYSISRIVLWLQYKKEQKANRIFLEHPTLSYHNNLSTDELTVDLSKQLIYISALQDYLTRNTERDNSNTIRILYEGVIWVSVFFLFVGLLLIIASFATIFG